MFYVLLIDFLFFFFKQKTAYEMRISDWSSDVCSSDLAVRRLGGDDEDGAVFRLVALLHMVRREGADLLVLGDAVGVFAGMAERRLVEVAGPTAADVEQDHPDCPADGRVGAIAGAEAVMPGVHADLLADRTVHHQERRHHMRRRQIGRASCRERGWQYV